MINKILLFSTLAYISISCTTLSSPNERTSGLTLKSVEQLKINNTNTAEAENIFGPPDLKVSLDNDQNAWLYLEGATPTTRLSLIFNKMDLKLVTVNWYVKETESESDIENALGRYPSAHFNKLEPEWSNSHSGPDELLFTDSKMNLEIVFQKTSKKVSTIRWESSVSQQIRKPSSKFEF